MEKRNKIPITVQLILKKDNQILLLRRYQTGYEDGKYCLPGGHVDAGEEIMQAMLRETKEEVGVILAKEDLVLKHILNRKCQKGEYLDFILQTEKWEGNPSIQEKNKADDLRWFSLTELPENILSYIPDMLNKDSIYISYGWEEEK
ncbi:MAG: NUDIX domain-containing protein [Clostridia bacterium]